MIKSNMLKKLSVAFSVLLMAGSLTACGGDEENNSSACAEGQVNVGGGAGLMAGCYDTCTADANCTGGNVCRSFPGGQKLCAPPAMTSNNPNNPMDCEAGKVKANYMGTEQCLVDCSADAATCAATEECTTSGTAKVCTPKAAPTCMEGEVETVYANGARQCYKTCTGDADCTVANTSCKLDDAGTSMICAPKSATDTLCENFCDLLFGNGLQTQCAGGFNGDMQFTEMEKMTLAAQAEACLNGNAQAQIAPCAQRFAQNPQTRAQAEALVAAGTDSALARANRCQLVGPNPQQNFPGLTNYEANCECAPVDHSKGCTTNADCDGKVLPAECVPETDADLKPPGGQCFAIGCHVLFDSPPTMSTVGFGFDTVCGDGGVCLASVTNGQVSSFCLESCTQNSDCDRGVTGADDAGYACGVRASFGNGKYLGACTPACNTDADCPAVNDANGNMVARVCGNNRSCEFACDPNSANGGNDACTMLRQTSTCVQNTRDNTKYSCSVPSTSFETGQGL